MSHAVQGHSRGWITEESSNETLSTGGGNGKPLQYSCQENPMNSMKRHKDLTPKDESQVGRCPICYLGRAEGNFFFFLRGLQRVGHDLAPEQVSKTHIIHIEKENSHV